METVVTCNNYWDPVHSVDSEEEKELGVFRKKVQELETNGILVCPLSDEYLLSILRHKKRDVGSAVIYLINWWKKREKLDDHYQLIYPSLHQKRFAEQRPFSVLKRKDAEGRTILLLRRLAWDPSKTSLMELVLSNYALYDILANRQSVQLNGLIQISDFRELGFSHLRLLNPSALKNMVELVESLPLKYKAYHVVNHGTLIHGIYAAAKIFLKPKLKKRIHFHGSNFSSLHEFVDPEILPEEYGGKLRAEDEWEDVDIFQEMLQKESQYRDFFDKSKYGIKASYSFE